MAAILWPSFTRNQGSGGPGITAYGAGGHGWNRVDEVTEANVQTPRAAAGVWSNLCVRVTANDIGTSTFKSRVASADGTQVATIGASATGEFEDTTHSDTVTAAQDLDWKLTTGSGGSSITLMLWRSLFAASSGSVQWYQTDIGGSQTLNGVTRFGPLVGRANCVTATEADVQHKVTHGVTFQTLSCNVQTNTKGGTSTLRLRVNTANGTLAVAIGAGVTGILSDTTHADAVAVGDLVNLSTDYFADANTLRFRRYAVEARSADNAASLLTASDLTTTPLTVALSVTTNIGFGLGEVPTTTEANAQTKFPAAVALSQANVYVSANSLTATSTIRPRVNGANVTLVLSVGSGATGWIADTTHRDSIAASDEVNWQIITGGSGTSITLNNLSLLYTGVLAAQRRDAQITQAVHRASFW